MYSLAAAPESVVTGGKLAIAFSGCSEFAKSHTVIVLPFPRPLLRAMASLSARFKFFENDFNPLGEGITIS